MLRLRLSATLLLGTCLSLPGSAATAAANSPPKPLAKEDSVFAAKVISNHLCPCGCGALLPGGSRPGTCFGCSVGKAEVARLKEGLAEGRSRANLLLELQEPVLIDVFADYSDRNLAGIWQRALRLAEEFNQHHVILRTPGRSQGARLAIRLAECARQQGAFGRTQEALIHHKGPWDQETLLLLAADQGLTVERLRTCFVRLDVEPQIRKDREHAADRQIERYPTITINRQVVSNEESALREALRRVIEKGSF